jgi:hypothetical protein
MVNIMALNIVGGIYDMEVISNVLKIIKMVNIMALNTVGERMAHMTLNFINLL